MAKRNLTPAQIQAQFDREQRQEEELELEMLKEQRAVAQERSRRKSIENDERSSKAYSRAVNISSLRSKMELIDWLKPGIIGALILIFIIGPGAIGIFTILQAIPWWMFIIGIFIAVAVWRDR
jgi:hypothetical protein